MTEELKRAGERWHDDLVRMKPWQVVLSAVCLGVVIFVCLSIDDTVVFNADIFNWSHLSVLARICLAGAPVFLIVLLTLDRKECELVRLRHQWGEELSLCNREVTSLRSDFLAVINHRMRTPIIATERAAALLAQGEFGPVNAEQQKILQILGANNKEVGRLLNMLVDLYRYREGTKHLEAHTADLGDVVVHAVDKLREQALAANTRLTTDIQPVLLRLDRAEISQLVEHLVENAIKYSRSNVRVSCAAEDGFAVISVRDDGRGMNDKDVANLFNRFYEISADGRYAPMTGIGLCLCSEIVHAHKGTIECQSTIGEQTTFTVRLPLPVAVPALHQEAS